MLEENAKHLAELHIHKGNIEKIAEALSELHPLIALEFLYEQAHHYRHLPTPNHVKVAIILEASKMINRKKPMKKLIHMTSLTPNHKKDFIETPKLTPAEIFEFNIAEFSI